MSPSDSAQGSSSGSAETPRADASAPAALMDETGRHLFETFELAQVLSHYDLGAIRSIIHFPRGSRKAPKLVLKAEGGTYLLKRRARGKDDPYRVAFCHGIQLHLASRGFPLPRLIGTRDSNNSILNLESGTYELFEFINGEAYDGSLDATTEAGHTLGQFHKILLDYHPEYQPAKGSYHRSKSVMKSLDVVVRRLEKTDAELDLKAAEALVAELREQYRKAANACEEEGLSEWPEQVVHSDWHPGNLLFKGSRVVAVIDYDAARYQQRAIDAANAALQFSIIGGSDAPEHWPDYVDESRFKRFVRGYDQVPDGVLTRAELKIMPLLMIEALVAEAAIPIAATGVFGNIPGIDFLRMVRRKAKWLREHQQKLVALVEG